MDGWICNAAFAFFITAAIPKPFLLSFFVVAEDCNFDTIRYQNCVFVLLPEAVKWIGTREWGSGRGVFYDMRL
jgi:hypothetical protein